MADAKRYDAIVEGLETDLNNAGKSAEGWHDKFRRADSALSALRERIEELARKWEKFAQQAKGDTRPGTDREALTYESNARALRSLLDGYPEGRRWDEKDEAYLRVLDETDGDDGDDAPLSRREVGDREAAADALADMVNRYLCGDDGDHMAPGTAAELADALNAYEATAPAPVVPSPEGRECPECGGEGTRRMKSTVPSAIRSAPCPSCSGTGRQGEAKQTCVGSNEPKFEDKDLGKGRSASGVADADLEARMRAVIDLIETEAEAPVHASSGTKELLLWSARKVHEGIMGNLPANEIAARSAPSNPEEVS